MKNLATKLAIVAFTALIASACSSNSILTAPKKGWAKEKSGLIVASLGYVRSNPNPYPAWAENPAVHVYVKSISDPKSLTMELTTTAEIMYGDAWKHSSVVIDGSLHRRLLVAYPAVPGRYKLWRKFSTFSSYGYNAYEYIQDEQTPLLFDVRAGEVTYIGSHELSLTTGENFLGVDVPRRALIGTIDHYEEDMILLTKLRPEFVGSRPTNAVQISK
jgi:hypothetical protein